MIRQLRHCIASAMACAAVALSLPAVSQTPKDLGSRDRLRAGHAKCMSNLKQVSRAMLTYALDHDEKLPSLDSAKRLRSDLRPYTKDRRLFICPVTGKAYEPVSALSRKPLGKLDPSWTFVALRDAEPHPVTDWVFEAYADGHVKGRKAPGDKK